MYISDVFREPHSKERKVNRTAKGDQSSCIIRHPVGLCKGFARFRVRVICSKNIFYKNPSFHINVVVTVSL